jgi:hypothetical protein
MVRNVSLRWWIGVAGVVESINIAGAERKLDAALGRRVRVGLEIGINEERILARLAVQLERVGPVDFVYIGAIAPPYRDPSNWCISTRLDNMHNADF